MKAVTRSHEFERSMGRLQVLHKQDRVGEGRTRDPRTHQRHSGLVNLGLAPFHQQHLLQTGCWAVSPINTIANK